MGADKLFDFSLDLQYTGREILIAIGIPIFMIERSRDSRKRLISIELSIAIELEFRR